MRGAVLFQYSEMGCCVFLAFLDGVGGIILSVFGVLYRYPRISVMPPLGLAPLRAFLPLTCVRACGQVLHHGFELGACLHDYHFDHEDFRLHFLLN